MRLTSFFVIALGFTWALQAPAVLLHDARFMPLAALGAFGPLVAALICNRGVRGFNWRWRVHPGWYALAVFGFGAIYVVARLIYRGDAAAWLYLPQTSQHVAALIMIPLIEEIGWRGYALPRLQQRFTPFVSSAILGLLWSAWHAMMFLSASTSPVVLAVSFINIFVGAFIFTWLFNRTQGSWVIAIAAHFGVHLNNPARASEGITPLAIYTVALAVVAVVLIAFDRRMWSR